ncbi:MAG: hypothetical protein L0Y68_05045 [Candidatus Dadabacteria bacterium]|nr:hypothetical protein [Candidatus Dadabacteria bacterium]
MEKREKVKIRKPVAKKPTKVILSKKDRMQRKRIKHKDLIKLAFLHESV